MTTAPTGEKPMNMRDRESDDLTQIDGIHTKTQQLLREQFNVQTFDDLANLSPDEIARLRDMLIPPQRKYVDTWIEEAGTRAAAANPSPHQPVESANPEAEEQSESSDSEGEWKTIAWFNIRFQDRPTEKGKREQRTHVWDPYNNDNDRVWQGIEQSNEPWRWILKRLNERLKPTAEPDKKPLAEAQHAAVLPANLEIIQIQAFQPPQAETPVGIGKSGAPFQGFVRSNEPFALEVSFEVPAPGPDDIAYRDTPYTVQFLSHNLSTGKITPLGDTKPHTLVEGKSSYTAVLTEATLQPGLYILRVLAMLHSTPPNGDYVEVPLLQVV